MIPEPTEADLQLDLQRAWNCSAFVDPPEAVRQVLRRCHAAERERDDLRIREREVTCVWCGHQFKSTLQSQAQHLYEHAKVCEKHPIHAAESQLAAMARDWSADHTHLQSLCRAAGVPEQQVAGDSHGVPGIGDLADMLAAQLAAARAEVERLRVREAELVDWLAMGERQCNCLQDLPGAERCLWCRRAAALIKEPDHA